MRSVEKKFDSKGFQKKMYALAEEMRRWVLRTAIEELSNYEKEAKFNRGRLRNATEDEETAEFEQRVAECERIILKKKKEIIEYVKDNGNKRK